ncbi:MAG TPA: ankyrin repeat domain-containing protein [Pyrinomonadaceae bacterium]
MDFWSVVESGDVEMLARVLPRVADINARNRNGMTALMKAAECGQVQTVRLLLEYGADPNLTRNDGFTALALAAFFGYTETVKTLMEFGARTEAVTRSGASAHTWATARTFAEVARCLDTQPRVSIQPRRRPARKRILALAVVASFILIVCGGLGALVLSKSEAHDLPREPRESLPPPPAVKKVENALVTNPQPEPPTPLPVVKEARPTIKKVAAPPPEEKTETVPVETPVAISEPSVVVARPKLDSPKPPPPLSPQIIAPSKKAKVIQWP